MDDSERVVADAPHVRVTVSQGTLSAYEAVLVGFEGSTLVASEVSQGVEPELLAGDMCLAVAEIPGLPVRLRVKFVAFASMCQAAFEARVPKENGNSGKQPELPLSGLGGENITF